MEEINDPSDERGGSLIDGCTMRGLGRLALWESGLLLSVVIMVFELSCSLHFFMGRSEGRGSI